MPKQPKNEKRGKKKKKKKKKLQRQPQIWVEIVFSTLHKHFRY